MLYTLDNFAVSMFVNMATVLKADGWDIFWHASGETDTQTSGGSTKGKVSLIQNIPADPVFITTGTYGDYAKRENIVIPAFAIQVIPPRKIRPLGLGDHRYEREVDIRIAGIATDNRQQATLASTLYEWLQIGETHFTMDIWDYSSNPASPTSLEKANVWFAYVTTPEVAYEVDSIRYQINIDLVLRYVE